MRLINTSTYLIEKFDDPSDVPDPGYAILSHTWVMKPDKEIELQDVRGIESDFVKAKLFQSTTKIDQTCKLAQAQTDPLPYAWIDTICIDQNSSSDKSEAINAMYRYYQNAKICFTHFCDVDGGGLELADLDPDQPDTADRQAVRTDFINSRWFKRGWTLQELLAPPELLFYDKSWNFLGSRRDLCTTISDATRIDRKVLGDGWTIQTCSVAQRMSWAAGRKTRRLEDRAYSLLGIFGVNMPMLYGEGEKAFIRLQEEIIKISDDQSLFAWSMLKDPRNSSLLARSPDAFQDCSDITHFGLNDNYPYSVSNRGIAMQLELIPWIMDTYIAPMNCQRNQRQLALFLRREDEKDKYNRTTSSASDDHGIHELQPGEKCLSPNRITSTTDHPIEALSKRLPVSLVHIQRSPYPWYINTGIYSSRPVNGFNIGPNLLRAGFPESSPWWKNPGHSEWDARQSTLRFTPGQVPYLEITLFERQCERLISPASGSQLPEWLKRGWKSAGVYFDDHYNPVCKVSVGQVHRYFDRSKGEVCPDYEHQSHTLDVEVDRQRGLDAFFQLGLGCDERHWYLHCLLRPEYIAATMGRYTVWVVDFEVVDDFEDNPWRSSWT